MIPLPLARFSRRLRRDKSGLALLEFAFSLPLVLGFGLYAVEMSSLALANLRVCQAALNLADNASRVGSRSALAVQQLREADINDVLDAARIKGAAWNLTTRGRITLSSLEEHDGKQVIHWQRCIGKMSTAAYTSHYGTTTATDGTDATPANDGTIVPDGMGETNEKVTAPPNSGVMFVEINYEYKPVVGAGWLPGGTPRLHYAFSFIVRDRRDFSQVFPSPNTERSTCDKFNS